MFWCGLGINVSLLIFCFYYGLFCYQVAMSIIFRLYLFGFDRKFVLLVKWVSRGKKNRREKYKKEKFQIRNHYKLTS